jgi:hypothetical protein
MPRKQHQVSGEKSGRNTSRSRHEKFNKIRKKVGDTKKCPGYPLANYIDRWAVDDATKKVGLERKDFPLAWKVYKPKWPNHFDKGRFKTKANDESIPHIGKNPTDISNFDLCTDAKDGLQAKCAACAYKWRKVRILSTKTVTEKYVDGGKYGDMYDYYKLRFRIDTKKCSEESTKKNMIVMKPVEEFGISKGMESGIHNMCISCAKNMGDATGTRWAIYNPDYEGSRRVSKKGKSCRWKEDGRERCKSRKKGLHKDHIIPLAKGGTDHENNFQILCDVHNLRKQKEISSKDIKNKLKELGYTEDIHGNPLVDENQIFELFIVSKILETMVCKRYHNTLDKAQKKKWDLKKFEKEMEKEVQEFILRKSKMSDKELKETFEEEKRIWNRKYNTDYHLKKFRKHCEQRNIK